jgi:uncharacterized membrane protein
MHSINGLIELVVLALEIVGVVVIVVGLAMASVRYLRQMRHTARQPAYIRYRHSVGRSIIAGLEFMIAADIIKTITVDSSLVSIAVLAAIVLIRTFLSFTLHLEVEGYWPWQQPPGGAQED